MTDPVLLDGLVLSALSREPSTGRGLARGIVPRARVHPTLRRLEREGLVSSAPLPRSRRQRLYRLTRAGAETLAVWRLTLRRAG